MGSEGRGFEKVVFFFFKYSIARVYFNTLRVICVYRRPLKKNDGKEYYKMRVYTYILTLVK